MKIVLTAVDLDLYNAWHRFCGDLDSVEVRRTSILDVECDALVSPANSFGFMDGGIDALYLRHFGVGLQNRVQDAIKERPNGELLVGEALAVSTGADNPRWLIVAPTMRVPMTLSDSVNPYLAARAALRLCLPRDAAPAGATGGRPGGLVINSIALPGLGTGVGCVPPSVCAHQVRQAIDEVLLGAPAFPRTWAEASDRHQLLYTDRPRRLQ